MILIPLSWQLNILSFGENEAKTLGVNLKMLRGITIVISGMLIASAVSISGTIGWIGLIIPLWIGMACCPRASAPMC